METIDEASDNGTICRFSCKVEAIGCGINNDTICDLFRGTIWQFYTMCYDFDVLASYCYTRVETIVRLPKINLMSSFCCCTSLRAGFQVYLTKRWVLICHQSSTIRFVVALSWIHYTLFLDLLANGGSKCGRCLAGGRGCLLKGPHLIPSLSELSSILRLPHFVIFHQLISFVCCKAGTNVRTLCPSGV